MKKRKKKWIFIVLASILVILAISVMIILTNDQLRFKFSYGIMNYIPYENGEKIVIDIPFDNRIKYLEGKEIIDTFTTGTGIIYLGYSSCPWCRNIIEPLIEVAKENDIDTIYYVNTYDNEFDDISSELMELLDDYLRVDEETNQKVLATPDVYFIKDGKIKAHHISTVESYRNPYRGMNDDQIKELKAIYQAGIEEIK